MYEIPEEDFRKKIFYATTDKQLTRAVIYFSVSIFLLSFKLKRPHSTTEKDLVV